MKIRVNVQSRRNQFGQGVSIAPSHILADALTLFQLEGGGADGAQEITIPSPHRFSDLPTALVCIYKLLPRYPTILRLT